MNKNHYNSVAASTFHCYIFSYISPTHSSSFSHHVFELIVARVQRLSDTLGQQDLMSQPLLAKGHCSTGDNHHLPALILQHSHLHSKTTN